MMLVQSLYSLVENILTGLRDDPLIFRIAGVCLVCHLLFFVFFQWSPWKGPWNQTSVFSAKQVITISMMVYQSYLGFVYWISTKEQRDVSIDLVQDEQEGWEGGVFLSQVVLGGLLQDIPVGIATNSVDTLMRVHHFGMFLVATIALGHWTTPHMLVATRYAPFFFGVVELSSIPLVIVDIFHPHKQPIWHQYATQRPVLLQLNEICRILFALLYIILRMVYFPYVIARQFVPDIWNKLQQVENDPYKVPLTVILVFSVMFTLLQLYWGTLILRQVSKAVQGGGKEKSQAKIKPV